MPPAGGEQEGSPEVSVEADILRVTDAASLDKEAGRGGVWRCDRIGEMVGLTGCADTLTGCRVGKNGAKDA